MSSNSLMIVLCLNVCTADFVCQILCFKKLHLVEAGAFAWNSVKIRITFGVRFEWRKVDKNKPTRKLKQAKSILASFEHFSQMSSKSILIISSYTVSNLVRFLRHGVAYMLLRNRLRLSVACVHQRIAGVFCVLEEWSFDRKLAASTTSATLWCDKKLLQTLTLIRVHV